MGNMSVNAPTANGVIVSQQNANGTWTSRENATNQSTGQTVTAESTGTDLMETQSAVNQSVQKALGTKPGSGASVLPNVMQGEPAGSNMPGLSDIAVTTQGTDGSSTGQAETFGTNGAETSQVSQNTTPNGSNGYSTIVNDERFTGAVVGNSGYDQGTASVDASTVEGSQDTAADVALSYLNDMNPTLPGSVAPGVTSVVATGGSAYGQGSGREAASQGSEGAYDASTGALLVSKSGEAITFGASALATGAANALTNADDSPLVFADSPNEFTPGSTAVPYGDEGPMEPASSNLQQPYVPPSE